MNSPEILSSLLSSLAITLPTSQHCNRLCRTYFGDSLSVKTDLDFTKDLVALGDFKKDLFNALVSLAVLVVAGQ